MTHAEQLQAKDRKIAQLRERCALLEQLLGEGIRHGYFDPAKCSASWLLEANAAVSILLGFRSANTITWCAREHLRSSTNPCRCSPSYLFFSLSKPLRKA